MATEQAHRWRRWVAGVVCAMSLPLVVVTPARAATAWWQPDGLSGVRVSAVAAADNLVQVQTPSGVLQRTGTGQFVQVPSQTSLRPAPDVNSGGQVWSISDSGQVLTGPVPACVACRSAVAGYPDPGAPNLGAGANLIAAPSATPGVVIAVSTGNVVWRRGQDGDWKVALLLLPSGGVGGVPKVTSVTAFAQPLSGGVVTDAVYLSTDGYSVMTSTDGGDDWIRAGPGLPDSVLGLSADPATKSVYAATANGLYVHVLQSFPAPPAYSDAALLWRWIGIVLISLVAAAAGALALLLALRRFAP